MAEELRTFAYICPECRQTVIAQRSAFSLAAGDCKIPCLVGLGAHTKGDDHAVAGDGVLHTLGVQIGALLGYLPVLWEMVHRRSSRDPHI